MIMLNEIEANYEANLPKMQEVLHQNEKYIELKKELNQLILFLRKNLDFDKKETLEEILELKNELFSYEQDIAFEFGFKCGVRLIKKL